MSIDEYLNTDPGELEAVEPEAVEPEAVEPAEPGAVEPEAEQHIKQVPYGALAEERERRRELQSRIDMMEERFQAVLAKVQPQAQAEPEVSFEDDPLGAIANKVQAIDSRLNQQTQQQQQQQQIQQFQAQVAAAEAAFAKAAPDYEQAVGFLQQRRAAELTAMGVPAHQHQAYLAQDAQQLVATALRQGRNPAEFAYNVAGALGYKAAAAAAAPSAEKIEKQAAGRTQSSIGGAGGTAATGGFTLDSVSKMSDEEFETAWKAFERDARRA